MTKVLYGLIEHLLCRQYKEKTLTCLFYLVLILSTLHFRNIFLKRVFLLNHQFQRAHSFSISPRLFLPPPLHLSVRSTHQSLPSVPICTLLVTLSTYLVPNECLCNQTYTYLLVRHSDGRLIIKLHHCELTIG